jgi:hypothetical protein
VHMVDSVLHDVAPEKNGHMLAQRS